ncbi:MAG: 6-phosphogluconolactonase [Candidatus Magasanikbacteria bacterium GW2011_GWA2_56_11]|uniref:6-phosphogluconolactonase n=1 Tax=Candidatus Magasanikbacteria bacterium GW2011_GWA2_56_11 TaxID=1619044 RepID=A0A0G1YGL1_9BACT|nr:MAG: 6-phosphogluconolactonase [Candidatus Magasanikbacteria bacterium GW2011_GWA2_56_11]
MELKTFSSAADFIDESVKVLAAVSRTKGPEDIVYIALSGGRTPLAVYSAYAEHKDVDFSRLEFFLVDERYVPFDHERSNYHAIAENFLQKLKGKSHGVHFIDTTLLMHKALVTYEKQLKEVPDHALDLVVLGMSPDGHIGSLFPRAPALHEPNHLVAYTHNEQSHTKDRLTLTFPTIMKAKRLLLLLAGEEKKATLEDLLHSDKVMEDMPAKKLLDHPRFTIHFYYPEHGGSTQEIYSLAQRNGVS